MTYFDNAATGGKKPDSVLSAVAAAIKTCANPGRGGHKLALAHARLVQDCRNELLAYFDGYDFDRVIFTKNCSEALNLAIFGVLNRGDHVIASCMEHNSVLRPLEFLKKNGVIDYDICPLNAEGNISPDDVKKRLRPNTRLAAITSASNVTGAIPPIKEIRKILPESVLLLCDGAQGGGHIPIKMRGAGIDLLTFAGHKGMLGIQGSGGLLFSPRVAPRPLLFGGTGSLSVSLDMPDFYPDALEAGTLSFPAILSLLEGVRYLSTYENSMREKTVALTARFLKGLKSFPKYKTYSSVNPCGIVAFSRADMQSEEVADRLSEQFDIAVRGGLHCAPLMHEALGTADGGLVRASFSAFNTEREIDRFLHALTIL